MSNKEWIDVEQELPDGGGQYIVTVDDLVNLDGPYVDTMFYYTGIGWHINPKVGKVLAWRPRPIPFDPEITLEDIADEFEDEVESELIPKGSRVQDFGVLNPSQLARIGEAIAREGCPHNCQFPTYCILCYESENEKRKAEPYDEVKDTLFQKDYRHKNL